MLPLSYDTIVYTSRTTICDIMSITTTSSLYPLPCEPSITKKSKLLATFPYHNSKNKPPVPQSQTFLTKYQQIQFNFTKSEQLKEERRLFLSQLNNDRIKKKNIENNAAIKIQALVRGYLVRPHPDRVRNTLYPPLKICCTTSNEAKLLQDELRSYAVSLGLKPIPGLTLESRLKHNKRKNQIEHAASLRIQSFFRMIMAILKVRKAALNARIRLQTHSAMKIQGFFRYVVRTIRKLKKQDENRELAAIKIQSHYRRFHSYHK